MEISFDEAANNEAVLPKSANIGTRLQLLKHSSWFPAFVTPHAFRHLSVRIPMTASNPLQKTGDRKTRAVSTRPEIACPKIALREAS